MSIKTISISPTSAGVNISIAQLPSNAQANEGAKNISASGAVFSQSPKLISLQPFSSYTNQLNTSSGSGNVSESLQKLFEGSNWGKGGKFEAPPSSSNFREKVAQQTNFVSELGLRMLQTFESFKQNTYVGVGANDKTIGFGSSETSRKPEVLAAISRGSISVGEAEDLMLKEVQGLKPIIEKHFGNSLNPNQMAVMVSLGYNGGPKAIQDLKEKAGGDINRVSDILPSFYITSGGKELEGLKNRRLVEHKLWNLPHNA
jgi:GH24 family phage-related lysozyme (muramidase)